MVDLTEHLESQWLSGENTKHGDRVVVINEGELVEREGKKGKYKMLELLVEYNKKQKTLTIGRASEDLIAQKYGKDTKAWLGKVLILAHTPDKVVNGVVMNRVSVSPE